MLQQVKRRVLVPALLDDHVQLDGVEARPLRRVDAFEHLGDAAPIAVHHPEDTFVQAVQAHGDALEAGIPKVLRLRLEARAVGRQRQVLQPGKAAKAADDLDHIPAKQRFASGDPNLGDAELHEQPGNPPDFPRGKPVAAGEELVSFPVDVCGHAVRAAIVAPVDHRDAQVAQGPAPGIRHPAGGLPLGHGAAHADNSSAIFSLLEVAATARGAEARLDCGARRGFMRAVMLAAIPGPAPRSLPRRQAPWRRIPNRPVSLRGAEVQTGVATAPRRSSAWPVRS